jgi:hypothetical protein
MERSSNLEATTAIIVAHPGHELLLHHWLEIDRPIVFALTDGSGGHGDDRRAMSSRIIESAGASVGPVFGLAPDKHWYAAILAGEYTLFNKASRLIAAACRNAGVKRIVTDSVEFYNPMHDLCNAVAVGIVRSLRGGGATDVELFDYAIEYPDLRNRRAAMELSLTDEALRRKQSAIASYMPLAAEADRHARAFRNHASERLYALDEGDEWPLQLAQEPFYEQFGRRRISDGVYRQLITYHAPVRPMAVALRGDRGEPARDAG